MNVGMIVIIVVVTAMFAVVLVGKTVRDNQKLRDRLQKGFGEIAEPARIERASIADYQWLREVYEPERTFVDDLTWDDLDMDLIFDRLNACESSVGEEWLYAVLHDPLGQREGAENRERLMDDLNASSEVRMKVQMALARLGKVPYNGLPGYIYEAESKTLGNTWLYRLLAALPLLFLAAAPFTRGITLWLFVVNAIANGVLYYQIRKKMLTNLLTVHYFAGVLQCCERIGKIRELENQPLVQKLMAHYKVFRSLRGKMPNAFSGMSGDLDTLAEYVRIVFLSDLRRYNITLDRICKNNMDFHCLYQCLGELDAAIGLLSFRKSLPFYTKPDYTEENRIDFSGLYHPLIKNPVDNDGAVMRDSIVTGSNASGKSTFIKALAVSAILAQTLNTCTARAFTLRPALIMTSMAVRDNVSAGDSYFITEIKSLKRILDNVPVCPCTCFIDEILKGTNTVERIAASAAVLGYLSRQNCLCVVASHDIELTEILKDTYDNYHFREQITDEGIHFDYKLKNGPSTTRNAIALLHYMAFDDQIVAESDALVERFLSTRQWC
ncbi:MutS-related protein [Eubacterium limosum]|uniref:MutS-related protein n=1 Tax=Eubacterium limosum TaxID=1736 RepID=UPI0022E22A38|nr:hypothetical protein [Eubacterium limosum]